MHSTKMETERSSWLDIFDAEGNHGCAHIKSRCDFVQNMTRGVGRSGENHYGDDRFGDCVSDGIIPGFAVSDIARRDPAADPGCLGPVANGIGKRFVFVRVTDEHIVGQAVAPTVASEGSHEES